MASVAAKQAAIMEEIVYAAFQTHLKCVANEMFPPGEDQEAKIRAYWDKHCPGVSVLWTGIVKAILLNTHTAQRQGLLPDKLFTEAPLPGLGGAPLGPRSETGPAALARGLATRLRGQDRPSADVPGARRGPDAIMDGPTGAVSDMPPGLAIGRATEDDQGSS